jgi:undecaprenyl-diphosphatase
MRALLQRMNETEVGVCLAWNSWTRYRPVLILFKTVSRLGNGVFWYSLIGLLAFTQGSTGRQAAVHMLIIGALSLGLYKLLKHQTVRDRPCDFESAIRPGAPVLDHYSFPSGHTLHAVGFTLIALVYFPSLSVVLVPFTLLTAASRIVLGLHYPSDVLVGALLGGVISMGSRYLSRLIPLV